MVIPTPKLLSSSKHRSQLIVAAAGSGKTKILVETLAYKIKNDLVDLDKTQVVVFTFTNNAADELTVRLSKELESTNKTDAVSKLFIGTIHGWCSNYLDQVGTLANTKVLSELEQREIVRRVYPIIDLKNLYKKEKGEFSQVDKFLKDLEIFYNENLQLANKSIKKHVKVAIQNYQKFIKRERLMDFGSLIKNSIDTLSEDKTEKPFELFIDEYQDVNPAQVNLFQEMLKANKKSKLIAVGDPRQAIYQWRGSDVERILDFKSDFRNSEVYELTTNYRSRTGIIRFANFVAKQMKLPTKIPVDDMKVGSFRKDNRISVVNIPKTYHSFDFSHIVKFIKKFTNEGCEPNHIAILLRSVNAKDGQKLMRTLQENNIEFDSPNFNKGTSFVNEFMISIIELFKLLQSSPIPQNRQEEQEIDDLVKKCLANIAKYCRVKDPQKIHLAVDNWYKKMSKSTRNENYNYRKQFFEFCIEVDFVINPSDIDIQEGFSTITQIMQSMETAYRRRFVGAGGRPKPPDILIFNLKWELDYRLARWSKDGMDIKRKNGVTVSTVHAAKGLEWSVVILPIAWQNRFPLRESSHGSSFPDKLAKRYGTSEEDEKRLWYVAITRPRDRLIIFSGGDKSHKPSKFVYPKFFKNSKSFAISSDKVDTKKLSFIEKFSRKNYLNVGLSDLLLLLECQYHFYMRKISGTDVPVGAELGAGDIMHKVIERLHTESWSTVDKIIDEEVFLPLAEKNHEKNMKGDIKKKIERIRALGFLKNIETAEFRFAQRLGEIIVKGIIDATKQTHKGVEIVDWKSSIHPEFLPRYKNQLIFYSGAMRNSGRTIAGAKLINAKDAKEITIDVSEKKFASIIKKAIKSISSLENGLPITEPSKITCAACDVSHICPDRVGKPKNT